MHFEPVRRRQFLKAGCLTAAAVVVAASGLTVAIPGPDLPSIDLPSFSFGAKEMNNRVLVAYATFAGSTAEVAAEISKILAERGASVDCKPIKENPQVDGYQSVLVGSAVQYGKWLPEAVEFVKANQQALGRVRTALFCVHITNVADDQQSRKTRLTFLNQVRPLVPNAAEAFFAGRFDRRGAALLLPGLVARLTPAFDLRDWNKIRTWARTVPA